MPIQLLEEQIRLRELGRLRLGEKAKGKGHPKGLHHWRITSTDERLLNEVAQKYGGNVQPWKNDKKPGAHFELYTETATLDVVVPPGQVGSFWMEKWSADGCTRRCDRVTDTITGDPCDCPADDAVRREVAKKGKACKPKTRLNVMLKGIPSVGLWRVETGGENALREMLAIAKVCELATLTNRMVNATLRIEPRTSKQPGQPTSHFVVPVLDVPYALDEIMSALGMGEGPFPELSAPAQPPALPESRPDLPADPGFETERGSGVTAVQPPAPPVPGPAPSIDGDDDVPEAEIVDTAADETSEGGGAPDSAEDGGAPASPPADDPMWSAGAWRDEGKKRGVPQRALLDKAKEIARENDLEPPSKLADLIRPEIAVPLRVWLLAQ